MVRPPRTPAGASPYLGPFHSSCDGQSLPSTVARREAGGRPERVHERADRPAEEEMPDHIAERGVSWCPHLVGPGWALSPAPAAAAFWPRSRWHARPADIVSLGMCWLLTLQRTTQGWTHGATDDPRTASASSSSAPPTYGYARRWQFGSSEQIDGRGVHPFLSRLPS